ncbi:CLUMA_CG011052, isoform A [Clunio marinus]|uniref:CLUMA_CG011052, isoform A n=1 Tax=Clunio marinus TaxID=568069 RepID=A0A1J1IBR7_9DIPT|nr:CLUMA_CG011052, isoform A [Clunio marinus]
MNFNLPKFSEFYKFVLVDELVLCNNPALIHYGKCSVIGYLSSSICVESISIPNIKRHLQKPDCTYKVPLIIDFTPSNYLNSTVEVFGEVKLHDELLENSYETSHSLIHKLRNLQIKLESEKGLPTREPSGTNDKGMHPSVLRHLQREIEQYKKTFKPVVQVHTIRHLQEAREVLSENLNYRIIQSCKNKK